MAIARVRSCVHTAVLGLGCALLVLAGPVSAAAPELRFVTESFPPYSFEREGHAAGPMVDVLTEACERLAWRCSVQVLPWRRALQMAQSGQVDGIFTVVDTPERRAYFHVSVPVIVARYTLFGRAGEAFKFQDRGQLAGRTIGAYGPSATVLALDELVEGLAVNTVIEPDNRVVLRKLAAGRYGPRGLALVNENVALELIREEQLQGLQAVGTVKEFSYAFGLSRLRVDARRAAEFDQALRALCRSGRSAALIKPYALPAASCAPR